MGPEKSREAGQWKVGAPAKELAGARLNVPCADRAEDRNRKRCRDCHAAARFAIFAMVARLQPVTSCIAFQDLPSASIEAMPALRFTSSLRPL